MLLWFMLLLLLLVVVAMALLLTEVSNRRLMPALERPDLPWSLPQLGAPGLCCGASGSGSDCGKILGTGSSSSGGSGQLGL